MFREKSIKIEDSYFGVGSTILGAPGEKWLVVRDGECIRLLDLNTFALEDDNENIYAAIPEYLTLEETRQVVNTIPKNYTFSDYTLKPTGLKNVK